MNIKTIILLRSVIRLLVQALELLNQIDDTEYRELVLRAQKQAKNIKGVCDSISHGNLFMCCFFTREIVEALINDRPIELSVKK